MQTVDEIDLEDCVVPKQFHDVVGYYNRFDIFDLKVHRQSQAPAEFDGADVAPRVMDFERLEACVQEANAAAQ